MNLKEIPAFCSVFDCFKPMFRGAALVKINNMHLRIVSQKQKKNWYSFIIPLNTVCDKCKHKYFPVVLCNLKQ